MTKSTGIKFLDMGLKSLGLNYDYNKAKKERLDRIKEAQIKSSQDRAKAKDQDKDNKDQAKEIAPNGMHYSENDIKYLMEQSKSWPNPLTREQAIAYLSKEEKYTKVVRNKEESQAIKDSISNIKSYEDAIKILEENKVDITKIKEEDKPSESDSVEILQEKLYKILKVEPDKQGADSSISSGDVSNTQKKDDYTSKIKATIDSLKKQYEARDTRVKEKDVEKQIIDPNKNNSDQTKEIAPNAKPYSETDIKY